MTDPNPLVKEPDIL
jgi:hypothetical protein